MALPPAGETNFTARTLRQRLADPDSFGMPFAISGTVIAIHQTSSRRIILDDGTGTMTLSYHRANVMPPIRIGDRITASGTIILKENSPWPTFDRYDVIGHGPPPVPRRVSASLLNEGTCDEQLVEINGILRDVFRDELDPDWVYFVLYDRGQYLYAALIHGGSTEAFEEEIGLRVSISGICRFRSGRQRFRVERMVWLSSKDDFRPANDGTASADGDLPNIDAIYSLPSSEIFELGLHCAQGQILASWQDRQSLLRTRSGRIVRLDISSGILPVAGDVIEAVGLPVPDLSQINLSHVRWTRQGTEPLPPSHAIDLNGDEMFRNGPGQRKFNTTYHGRAVRLDGRVATLSAHDRREGLFALTCNGFSTTVDCTANPHFLARVEEGATLGVSGICIIESAQWNPGAVCPRVKGFRIVPGSSTDIVLLASPPWWTPTRLALVIAVLLLVLGGICAWNVSLRRLAERRGREIAAIDIARAEATLKTHERTRLAVELHDSIAQNLTGAVMELKAAHILAQEDPQSAMDHVSLATKTLDSCRDDLRNCIWDLRNQTLEEICLDEAIRKTVLPHIADTELNIRFNVPRTRLSDNTTHDILRIIRELCINAVRHGNATTIRIAGCLDGDRLLSSVADNGCGFDPARAPGIVQGHFGLQGIRDRTKAFDGTMHVESRLGAGTKVTITLCLPPPKSGTPS